MMKAKIKQKPLRKCPRTHLVIFNTELDAKIVLAYRQHKDRGEKRYFRCGSHYHLTAQEEFLGRND